MAKTSWWPAATCASGPSSRLTVLQLLQLLQGRVPGVLVSGTEPNMNVQIRGNTSLLGSSPLFLLDGGPVTIDAIAHYPAADVETIEILKGGQAALYGSRGSGGVVAICTRRGSPNYDARHEAAAGVAALRLPGFYCGRELYVPRYDAPQTNRDFPDARRSTLYRNPSVRTDAAGQADVRFFTSDAKGEFQFKTEGLAGTGQPAQGAGNLRVE